MFFHYFLSKFQFFFSDEKKKKKEEKEAAEEAAAANAEPPPNDDKVRKDYKSYVITCEYLLWYNRYLDGFIILRR